MAEKTVSVDGCTTRVAGSPVSAGQYLHQVQRNGVLGTRSVETVVKDGAPGGSDQPIQRFKGL